MSDLSDIELYCQYCNNFLYRSQGYVLLCSLFNEVLLSLQVTSNKISMTFWIIMLYYFIEASIIMCLRKKEIDTMNLIIILVITANYESFFKQTRRKEEVEFNET